MEPTKDGGPAFPFSHVVYSRGQASYEDSVYEDGMTLRDYFAAKVMQGICAGIWPRMDNLEEIALRSYQMADVMLKARQ